MDVIDISRAKELFKKRDFARFIEYCLSFDKIEDGDDLGNIGICYRDGKGETKDIDKAISNFENTITYHYLDNQDLFVR